MCNSTNHKEYMNILLEIAKIQRCLISYAIDWNQRKPIYQFETRRIGLFGLKKSIPANLCVKTALIEKLETLRKQARDVCDGHNGYYWWDVPWEQVEQSLLNDLVEDEQDGQWRFEYRWDKILTENAYCIMLNEEGHCNSFSGSSNLEFYETSRYTDSERREMIRKYSNQIRQNELNAALVLSGTRVQSGYTGEIYNSVEDYLLSVEHYVTKEHYKTAYKNSLSTEHQRNIVRVTSNSMHYHSVYFMAEYCISENGWLVAWNLKPYTLLDGTGDLLKRFVDKRQQKDAVVSSVAFLADQPEITAVPCSLFGGCMENPLGTFDDAVRYSELFTCISKKLILDE